MALTPVPHCVKVELRHLIDGQNVWNTFYAQCPSEPDATEIEEMLLAAQTYWHANWASEFGAGVTLQEIVGTSLTSLDGARVVLSVSPPDVGTNIADVLPLNATIAIKRSVGHRGKGRSGRVYWPQLREDQVSGDRVNGTELDGIVNKCEGMGAAIAGAGPDITLDCVAHQSGSHAGTSEPIITYSASDDYIDSQRDRLPRHKRHKKPRTPSVP